MTRALDAWPRAWRKSFLLTIGLHMIASLYTTCRADSGTINKTSRGWGLIELPLCMQLNGTVRWS